MAGIAAGVRSLGYSKIKQRSSFYSDSDSDSDSDCDYSFEAPRPRLTNPKTTQPKTTQHSSVSSSSSSRNNNALLSTRISTTKTTQHSSVSSSSSSSSRNNDALLSTPLPARLVVVTMTCLDSDKRDERLVLPRTLEELKYVGVYVYGAPFMRLFDKEGVEISDLRDMRDGDRVVYAIHAEELNARVTITCFEKEDVEGRPVLLPRSLEELKKIGVEKYGASFVRVLNEEGAEINDIRLVRNGDRVDFASHKSVEEDGHNWFEDVWRSLLSEREHHAF